MFNEFINKKILQTNEPKFIMNSIRLGSDFERIGFNISIKGDVLKIRDNLEKCRMLCLKISYCFSFDYDSLDGYCYLKDTIPVLKEDSRKGYSQIIGMYSGVLNENYKCENN